MKKVLFVCVENSCRSQMAEAFAKMYGKGIIEAYSSGSCPSGVINPKAIESMKTVGYDLSKHRSIGLDKLAQMEYDYVITMGCGDACPVIPTIHREDWNLPDPKNMELDEFAKIRDIIESEVRDLISEITQEKD